MPFLLFPLMFLLRIFRFIFPLLMLYLIFRILSGILSPGYRGGGSSSGRRGGPFESGSEDSEGAKKENPTPEVLEAPMRSSAVLPGIRTKRFDVITGILWRNTIRIALLAWISTMILLNLRRSVSLKFRRLTKPYDTFGGSRERRRPGECGAFQEKPFDKPTPGNRR